MTLSPKKASQARRINELKAELGCEILSHHYMRGEVKDLSDFVGGTRAILQRALCSDARALVVCGVGFLVGLVRAQRPDIPVLVPREDAACPLANRGDKELIGAVRARMPWAILVAGPKCREGLSRHCDTIMALDPGTGAFILPEGIDPSRALVIPSLFTLKGTVPERLRDLAPDCQVHAQVGASEIMAMRIQNPGAALASNSLCSEEVKALSDFSGDSDSLARFAELSPAPRIILIAECGLAEGLSRRFPEKTFIEPITEIFCPNMKLTNIKDILAVLEAHAVAPLPYGAQAGLARSEAHDIFG
ncbi:MAG: quinolinate synthase NadA [Deltaproteobacteria bacterium]|jgi:quinolinate synthase|nr:quinolinate synthase NadA [Deltaproteobacteria bacterium]